MAKGPHEYALAKASGIMLAGADFIERRAAKDGEGCCREVIVRLDDESFTKLVQAGLAERATPSTTARSFVLAGLGGKLATPKTGKNAAKEVSEDSAELRRQLSAVRLKLADAIKKAEAESASTRTVAEDIKAARAAQRQAEDERDQWRERESETQEALQVIGDAYGVLSGEPRVAGITRVLGEQRAEIDRIKLELMRATASIEQSRVPAPSPRAAPELSKSFLKLVAGFRWTDSTPTQIAAALGATVEDVKRAIDINSWNKS